MCHLLFLSSAFMFIQLLFLASFGRLYASPIDPHRHLSQDTDSFLYTRDPATGTGENLRTTYGIVWSCLVTILACVWSAVHPNIPGPYDGRWTIIKRRMTMTFCALIAPELVVLWALRQHLAAKEIVKLYNERFVLQGIPAQDQSAKQGMVRKWLGSAKKVVYGLFADLPHDVSIQHKPRLVRSFEPDSDVEEQMTWWWHTHIWKPLNDRVPWTMTHGFFMQMGGFMLYEGGKPKKVLEFRHMCYLIGTGQIAAPTVTEAELKDRSKGNVLSKCVIVLQTSWFVVQCLARLASRLPLSELEVVTLAFAVMNGIVYWVWWDKPQGVDIAIPIHLQFPDAHRSDSTAVAAGHGHEIPTTSGLETSVRISGIDVQASEVEVGTLAFGVKNGIVYWVWREKPQGVDIALPIHLKLQFPDAHGDDSTEAAVGHAADAPTTSGLNSLETGSAPVQTLPSEESQPLSNPQAKTGSSMSIPLVTRSTVRAHRARLWWGLAGNLWNKLKSFSKNILVAMAYPFVPLFTMIRDSSLPDGAIRVPIFYSYILGSNSMYSIGSAASLIGALFGAVHFFAWASVFPSPAEQIIWRVSALITTVGPLLSLLAVSIGDKKWLGNISEKFENCLVPVTAVVCVLGRIALVTVALLSLRALPKDVFVQVNWTSFIPHF